MTTLIKHTFSHCILIIQGSTEPRCSNTEPIRFLLSDITQHGSFQSVFIMHYGSTVRWMRALMRAALNCLPCLTRNGCKQSLQTERPKSQKSKNCSLSKLSLPAIDFKLQQRHYSGTVWTEQGTRKEYLGTWMREDLRAIRVELKQEKQSVPINIFWIISLFSCSDKMVTNYQTRWRAAKKRGVDVR